MASILQKVNTTLSCTAAASRFRKFNPVTKNVSRPRFTISINSVIHRLSLLIRCAGQPTNCSPSEAEKLQAGGSKPTPQKPIRRPFSLGAYNDIVPTVFLLCYLELWARCDDMRTLSKLGWPSAFLGCRYTAYPKHCRYWIKYPSLQMRQAQVSTATGLRSKTFKGIISREGVGHPVRSSK